PSRRDTVKDIHGFFPRLLAHVKYTLMKRHRPWSVDDVLALFSWIFMSNAAFILVGTTTFASLLLALANSLQFQEFIAQRVGEYLTYETGVEFVFESAIVPNWRDGKIRLRNVVLSRGPQRRPAHKHDDDAAITAAAATTTEAAAASARSNGTSDTASIASEPSEQAALGDTACGPLSSLEGETSYGIVVASPLEAAPAEEDTVLDTNLTMFRLTVDQVEVTLNMMRWFDGKGLLEHVSVSGVRGTVDRSHVYWDPDVPFIPAEHRHPSQPGDFELNSFSVNDLLVTMIQPGGFRPFKVSVISAHVPRLRKRWLLYDLLCADSVVGMFDDCLFSMHRAQQPATSPAPSPPADPLNGTHHRAILEKPPPEQRMSELRVDGINIDHLNAGVTGPFGWITSATVDISAHITFPVESDDDIIGQLLNEWVERIDAMAAARQHIGTFHDDLVASLIRSTATKIRPSTPAATSSSSSSSSSSSATTITGSSGGAGTNHSKLIIDLGVRFNNVKASVPLVAQDLSYVNNALIRPVVAYMNWHRTCIPVRCSVGIDLSEFDGAWTVYEAGLVDQISEQVGRALVQLTTDERERNRRLKRVGLWGLQ
ncbi:mitochondrial distribution and morphology protein family 31/32, partial [Syncephalis pseudoplumigaleata]